MSTIGALPLTPRPRTVRITGPPIRLRASDAIVREESIGNATSQTIAGQRYRLSVSAGRAGEAVVRLDAGSPAGLRYARATLEQLRCVDAGSIPAVEIEDEPAFAVRGVMLDISRDRVPTMAHLREIVTLLAGLKINHLQLYTEHTFAYAGHERVWQGWSPMTPDEIRTLDRWCADAGIELAANQNCFGHLSRWFAHEPYRRLAETLEPWTFGDTGVIVREPYSLCPSDPGSIALIGDLLSQLLPCFTSKRVNIGCDETFDVGQGRSRDEVARRGFPAVYFDFVDQVFDLVRNAERTPMFWADMALSHPESINRIPPEVISLAWGYEPDSDFSEWGRVLSQAGRPFWVVPGTSSWRAITGRTAERRENLRGAASAGEIYGAGGFMVADWGDLGHRQQWPVSLIGLAEGAAVAWEGQRWGPDPAALDAHVFGAPGVGEWLGELGDADRSLRRSDGRSDRRLTNATALFVDRHDPPDEEPRPGWPVDRWVDVSERLRSLRARLPTSTDSLFRAELQHAVEYALAASEFACFKRTSERKSNSQRLVWADRWIALAEEHARLWLQRSREGGLAASRSYDEALAAALRCERP